MNKDRVEGGCRQLKTNAKRQRGKTQNQEGSQIMKKFSLTLTVFGFCLAFISAAQAETAPASQMPSSPSATTPNNPSTSRSGDPGTTHYIKRSVETPRAIPDDPAVRKNEANFRAAVEKCNAIVNKDSKTNCMNEAETNYSNGRP
jgi:hypothetical protein